MLPSKMLVEGLVAEPCYPFKTLSTSWHTAFIIALFMAGVLSSFDSGGQCNGLSRLLLEGISYDARILGASSLLNTLLVPINISMNLEALINTMSPNLAMSAVLGIPLGLDLYKTLRR